jgi:DNA-directed RNA polymerase specialized sigma subunit
MIQIHPATVLNAQSGSNDAKMQILDSMYALIYTAIKKYPIEFRKYWIEDLKQSASLGVLDAITKFNTSRSQDFKTYAMQFVKDELRDLYNQLSGCFKLPIVKNKQLIVRRSAIQIARAKNGMKVHNLDEFIKYLPDFEMHLVAK